MPTALPGEKIALPQIWEVSAVWPRAINRAEATTCAGALDRQDPASCV